MPNLPSSVIDSALNQSQRQDDEALGRSVAEQAAPIRRALFGALPDLGSLLGGLNPVQEQQAAPSPTYANPPQPAPTLANAPQPTQTSANSGGFQVPGLDSLLSGLNLGPKPAASQRDNSPIYVSPDSPNPPTVGVGARAPSGTPAAMPTGQPTSAQTTPTAAPASEALGPVEEGNPERFFATAGPYARRVEQATGIPAALSLAIAANETGYGQRRYMAGANNYHGIQAQPGEAGAVPYKDWRPDGSGGQQFYDAAQRSFADPEAGFAGFASFLRDNKRYAPALARYQQSGDVEQLARDIHGAGYAEDPKWSDKLISIMRGIPTSTGVGEVTAQPGVRPTAASATPAAMPEQAPASAPAQAAVRVAGRYARNQGEVGNELGLPWARTIEICGPVAAAAFLRKTGRMPGQEEAEAMRVAQEKGYWKPGRGMGGTATEEALLTDLGVATRRIEGAPDWAAVAADVQRGNPVIIDAVDHYMVAEGYDPQTGAFDFGETAGFLRGAKGRTTFRPDELPSLSGPGMTISPIAVIYLDNPQTPTPSVVAGRSPTAGAPQPAESPPQPPAGGGDLAVTGRGRLDSTPLANPSGAVQDAYRVSLGEPSDEPLPAAGWPGSGMPGYGVSELDNIDYQTGKRPGETPYFNTGSMEFPIVRGPGAGVPEQGRGNPNPQPVPKPIPNSRGRGDGFDEDAMYRQPLLPTDPEASTGAEYDPRDADSGPWEATPPTAQTAEDQRRDSGETPYNPDQGPRESGYALPATVATYGDAGDAPRVPAYRPTYGPEPVALPSAIGAVENARAGMADQEELAPRPGLLETVTAPARSVYGPAIAEANETQDEIAARNREKFGALAQAAAVPLETINRAVSVANAVLMATPQAAADTIDAALAPLGLGRADIGIDLPVVGRIGVADIVDVGPFTNVGIGRAGGPTTAAGRAVSERIPNAAGGIERGAGAAIGAGREIVGQGIEAARGLGTRVAGALDANAARMAEADARMAAEGSTAAPAAFGQVPQPSSGRPTVEALQQRLAQARAIVDRLIDAGDPERLARAQDNASAIESALVDAMNARRAIEPAIASDVGRRIESLPMPEQTADDLAGLGRERVRGTPEELSGPVGIPTDMSGRMNAGFGVVPDEVPRSLARRAPAASGDVIAPSTDEMSQAWAIHRQVQSLEDMVRGVPENAPDSPDLVRRLNESKNDLSAVLEDLDGQIEEAQSAVLEADRAWGQGRYRGSGLTYDEAVGEPLAELQRLKDERAQWPPTPRYSGRPSSIDAPATAGTLPSAGRTSDPLSAVNRALGQGVMSSVSGGVGAAVNQEMNPDDPNAAIKGFAVGALGPLAAARGARAIASRRGARTAAEGALATLGEVPNGGRRIGLPGFERIDPLTDPVTPPITRTAVPTQTIGEALPGIVRALQPTREPKLLADSGLRSPSLPTLEQPVSLLRRVRDVSQPWVDRFNILRYAGMLSDTAGQIFNLQSNVILAGRDLAVTPIAAAIDVGRVGALRATGRQADRQVFFGEVPARIAGMRAGSRVGLQPALDILRSGLPAEEAAKLTDQSAAIGFRSGSAVIDFAAESPLRALAASDAVFRSSAAGGHLMAEAYAAARRANKGKPPTPEMVREAAKNPDLLERVQSLAARSVLQEDRAITRAYQQFIRAIGPAGIPIQLEVPFVKTPYNVMAQGMGMTPAGLLGLIQDMGKLPGDPRVRTAREVEYRLANVALGTAIMAGAASSVAAGEWTGPYPTDAKERSTLPPGWRPWSRKVEVAGQTYYAPVISAMGPLGLPIVVSILANEAQKQGKSRLSPEWAGAVALGVGRYAAQNSFFEGVANVAKVMDERQGASAMEQQIEQIASQFSPHILGGGALGREIQRIMGMPARDPEGALEALLATHPATAGRVEPRQDVLGRPASMGVSGPAGALVRAGVEDDAAVIRAFRKAGEGLPTQAPKQIRDPGTEQMRTLNASQRHRWRRVFGTALREEWSGYGNSTDVETLRKAENAARSTANETVLGMR